MIALCTSSSCRRKGILAYFGEAFQKIPCHLCDNCLDDVEMCDETVAAQKILSCVYRLKFQSGTKHVIDVLRGMKTKSVMEQTHDKLSTFGIMKEVSENKLFFLIHALIQKGLLEKMEYSVLRWTATSSTVTNGGEKVMIPKQVRQKSRERRNFSKLQPRSF